MNIIEFQSKITVDEKILIDNLTRLIGDDVK